MTTGQLPRLAAPPLEPAGPERQRRSAKADAVLFGVVLFALLCGAAVLQLRSHPALVVSVDSSTADTAGSASTFAPVELTSVSETAVLVGTAAPRALVRVLDRQVLADDRGGWRITVDLVPGVNHFQAVATDPFGVQVATNFTVVFNPPTTVSVPPTPPSAPTTGPPTESTSTTAVETAPALAIASPLDGAVVTTDRVTFLGTATPGATVDVAGAKVTAANNGRWAVRVTLKPGMNRITVTAVAGAGSTSAAINVRYDAAPTTTTTPVTVPNSTTTTIPVDTEPVVP